MERQRVCIAGVARENHSSDMPSTLLRLGEGLRASDEIAGNGEESSGAERTWKAAASDGMSHASGPLTAHVLELNEVVSMISAPVSIK